MDYFHSLIMGIIQGITEFLPVSSSAHLALYPKIFNVHSALLDSVSYDVALHAGTLVALVVFFWKRIMVLLGAFFKGLGSAEARKTRDFRMGLFIIIATIPGAIVGFKWNKYIEETFRDPVKIGILLAVFGLVLWLADAIGKKTRVTGEMNFFDSAIIGIAQALALIPGVSRSGITITAGMFLGFKREDAAEFSFIMSIPIVAGDFLLEFKHLIKTASADGLGLSFIGFAAAAITGIITIKFMLDFVRKNSYVPFVIYRVVFGIVLVASFVKW